MNISKLRTISGAFAEIKEADPNSAITKYAIRAIINSNCIPVIHRGKKAMFDIDDLYNYLRTGSGNLELE